MNQKDIIQLIQKQEDGSITTDATLRLKQWYEASADNRKIYKDYCVILKATRIEADKRLFESARHTAWSRLLHRVHADNPMPHTRHKAYTLLKYAAAIVCTLVLGGMLGLVFYSRSASSQGIVAIYAPAGSKSCVTLPDGTKVWLNSDSRITYDADFGKEERRVDIDGEGFFSVAKDRKRPFVVTSEGTSIKVLGTKFDIKAFRGDPCKRITLVEGSLSVSAHGILQMLKPNQQALVMNQGIRLREVKAREYSLWTKPAPLAHNPQAADYDRKLPTMIVPTTQSHTSLIFDNEPLSQIVKDLQRTFNVEIRLEANVKDEVFYGDLRNGENLYQILDIISLTADVKYRISQGKVIIYK